MRRTKSRSSKPAKRKLAAKKQSATPRVTPRYESDDGPPTDEQMEAIYRLQPQGRFKGTKSLF